MLMLDLFSGFGGASAAMRSRGWDVVSVDILSSLSPTVVADLRTWSYEGPRPDLVWASPPCAEFSRHGMPWTRKRQPAPPSLDLVNAARRIIAECSPRWWVIENVRAAGPFLRPLLGKPALSFPPYFLWGNFPPFTARVRKRKERLQGWQKQERARVPMAISLGLALACERAPTWIPCPCCENFWCLAHDRHAFECACPPIEEWTRDPYGCNEEPQA